VTDEEEYKSITLLPRTKVTEQSCREVVRGEIRRQKKQRGEFVWIRLFETGRDLDRPYVLGLPAFRTLGDAELDRLALLQASEPARLDRREMHENVFAILAADKAIALGVVKPLYCSLFHKCSIGVPFLNLRWKESEETCAGD
jgi:hypothetical protein